jgi:hypothetical protein
MLNRMPDTRLILHVKGTAAETAELSRKAVKDAISQGKITHSQLIWRPEENAWKQVRELPELLPAEHLILHVKGTTSETHELPKQAVREAISQGKITHSQLIWRPAENAWKQVGEIPELLPGQKLSLTPGGGIASPASNSVSIVITSPNGSMAPATQPQVRVATAAPARAATVVPTAAPPAKTAVATPTVAPQTRAAGAPPAAAPSATAPRDEAAAPSAAKPTGKASAPVMVRSTGDLQVKHEEGMHFMRWVCLGLGLLIAVVVGTNYFLVDKPLNSNLSETRYANIMVYAHLGAFMQPNVVVIHIPNAPNITPANLTKVLVELARSTPRNPITHELFGRVALTNSWTAQYSFSGDAWNQLAGMTKETDDQRKEFILTELGDAGGQSLMPESANEDLLKSKLEKVWHDFVGNFTGNP